MGTVGVTFLCVAIFTCVNGSPAPVFYDTIVVGLGASGTAAASALAAAGRKVLALEAQDRIGGRVYTVPFGDSVVELGAEWIHGTENSVTYELAQKNNVTILEQQMERKVYRSDGSSDKEDLVLELSDVAMEAYDNLPEEIMSVGEHISGRVRDYINGKHPEVQNDTEFINNFLDYIEIFFGTNDAYYSWNNITTKSTSEDLGGSQVMSWHKLGYKTLFDILLNKYNNGPGYPTLDIKLNTEVTKIQWPQDPNDNVVVTVTDGTTYTANNVIVTVSVAMLKERYKTLFSPALPEDKVHAIEAISMGESAKIIFRFDDIWWPNNTLSMFLWRDEEKSSVIEEDRWLTRVNLPGSPMANSKALTLWACGDDAKKVESLPNDVLKEKVMGLIRLFMGKDRTISDPVEIIKSSWYSNPFTRGVYSYDDINTPNHPTVRSDLRQPLVDSSGAPRVLFAGEATESKHFATVHGAVETGRREANRLLSAGSH